MLKSYLQLMRFHKPVGTFLLLWPTLWALWIAGNGHPSFKNVIIFVLGVIFMRAAGCVINDFADRKIDLHVTRTKTRPLTTGVITKKQALILFLSLCAIAFFLVLLTNVLTIILSFFALLTAIIYPFMKRVTHWPQFFLSIAFAWSVPMAFAAQINHVPWMAFLIMLTTIFWVIAYDTQYAMADHDEDIKIGVKSTAILFGRYDRVVIGVLQLMFILFLCIIGALQSFSRIYFITVFAATLLMIYQQILIAQRAPNNCLRAFLNNQWVGAVVFLGIFVQ